MQTRIPRLLQTQGVQLADAFADAQFFYSAPSNADVSRFTLPTTISGVIPTVGGVGKVLQIATTGSSTNFQSWATSTRYDPRSSGFTMFFYGQRLAASSANYDRVFTRDLAQDQGAGNRFGFLLAPPGDGTAGNCVYFFNEAGTTGTNVGYASGLKTSPTDRFALYLVTHDGSTARIYLDGLLQSSAACSLPSASSRSMILGTGSYTTLPNGAPFNIAFAGMLPRAMPRGEIQKFAQNPWSAFKSRRVWIPVASAGGADVLINCTAGNAVADGVAAQINQARRIDSTPGNAVADGVTAKIDQARRIDATAGNAAADGVTAKIDQARVIAATPGNAVAAGVDAAIIRAVRIDATPGGAVADGVLATILGDQIIIGSPGNAAADGVTAQINQARVINCTPGNAAANGVTAEISTASNVVVNATPGNATADGVQALLIQSLLINAVAANAVAAGVEAQIITEDSTDDLYPLEGMSQDYPLQGLSQTYPLQGQTPS